MFFGGEHLATPGAKETRTLPPNGVCLRILHGGGNSRRRQARIFVELSAACKLRCSFAQFTRGPEAIHDHKAGNSIMR